MLLKSLGLSVCVTDAAGVPLPEYQQKQTKDDVIECWIPSTEGANFKIKWEITNKALAPAGCDACATPYFDGVKFGSVIGRTRGELRGHRVGHTTIRLYQFGKRRFTDEEDISLFDAPIEDLGTIRVNIDWGHFRRSDRLGYFSDPTRGPVHEKLVKKGFGDSAALGRAIDAPSSSAVGFIQEAGTPSGTFIFRYASEGVHHPTSALYPANHYYQAWLQAQDIISYIPKSEASTKSDPSVKPEPSGSGLGQKRTRPPPTEVIDVDAIEDDDDEITIINTKKPKLEGKCKP
ncbi:unnamed protein product [Rhizoctonia solani]|uniref:DUF7918 domain-containing protein n=1 Tax=Rhizoctonia solani TaxID=456999 RepID=A0A8H3AY88_9AGAM|nr:unnamed protein product [Rhizoctonia solani]